MLNASVFFYVVCTNVSDPLHICLDAMNSLLKENENFLMVFGHEFKQVTMLVVVLHHMSLKTLMI